MEQSTPDTLSAPGGLPRNVWATTLTSFFTDVSSEMILNLVPLFLANVLGAPATLIGLIEGIAETTSSLLKVASGWLSDKWQSRKGLAVAGYALSASAKPLLYFVATPLGVLLVRVLDRVGKGIRTAPRDALIADSINEQQRGRAFGLHRAGDTAGAVIGLLIALMVVLASQAQAVNLSLTTFQTLVLVSIIPGVLGVLTLFLGVREVPPRPRAVTDQPQLTFGALAREFKIFLGILAIFTLGNSADAFIVLRAQERGLTVAGVLGMLITFNLVYSVLATPLGSLSDRIGRERLLIGGWLVYGVLYLGFAFATEAWHIWLIYTLYGVYYAAVEGTAKAFIADLIPSEQRGTAYGYYNATIGLMALPASFLAGLLWQSIAPNAPFLLGSGLALAAALLLWRWRGSTHPQSH